MSRFLIALQEANNQSFSPGEDDAASSTEQASGRGDSLVFARIIGSMAASLDPGASPVDKDFDGSDDCAHTAGDAATTMKEDSEAGSHVPCAESKEGATGSEGPE